MGQWTRRRFLTSGVLGGTGLLWLRPVFAVSGDPASFINPLIGASTSTALGEGKTFPGATCPFGMVQLSPDTILGGDNAPGYSYEHKSIEGFSYNHMSGVGWYGDFGNLLTMPATGELKLAPGRPDHPDEGWRSQYRHDTETAEAGYYAVTLDRYQIRVELTATQRAGMLRLTYPASRQSSILVDFARRIGGTSSHQSVRVLNGHTIEGEVICTPDGGGWGDGKGNVHYTLYFRTEFSKPFREHGFWNIEIPPSEFENRKGLLADFFETDAFYELVAKAKPSAGGTEHSGNHTGFYASFETHAGEQVIVKTGLSLVSMEGARKNLQSEIPGFDFDRVRGLARQRWSDAISCIQVEGGTESQRRILETALYHTMIDPRDVTDVDGFHKAADGKPHRADRYTYRSIFSGWDVYRAQLPLMSIVRPSIVSDQINSLLELAELSGKGYLERWEIMNSYSGCMDGDPALAVILDAYTKGIRSFDVEKAYRACLKSAKGTGTQTGRPDNDFYLQNGYVPEQVSWTLDNAYFDWCVGKLAQELGKQTDAEEFFRRAKNYKNIFDPSVGYLRARERDGSWMKWQGEVTFGQGCTESNPLQSLWSVPHDVYGLMGLIGKESFVERLEDFFARTPITFGWNPYYNHSNEPVHHIPYLFVYAGKPWLTQKWVRRILNNAYHDAVNGICGNDDVGQMSAWYVMSAIGFYPVCPGDGIYIIGSPLFDRAVIRPQGKQAGGIFEVVAANNTAENCYIRSAKLNGIPLTRAWIRHSEIVSGGRLELVMDSQPNREWAASLADLPPSMSPAL